METPTGWIVQEGKLVREFSFENFIEALAFINKVGGIAERLNHHPEIWNSYSKVKLTLFTHDTGSTTEKDTELAKEINVL